MRRNALKDALQLHLPNSRFKHKAPELTQTETDNSLQTNTLYLTVSMATPLKEFFFCLTSRQSERGCLCLLRKESEWRAVKTPKHPTLSSDYW